MARRHANRNVTTAAIDNLQFKEAVYENSIVVPSRENYLRWTDLWKFVLTVLSRVFPGERKLVNTAYLVKSPR